MRLKPLGVMVSSPIKKYYTYSRKRGIMLTDISVKMAKNLLKKKNYYASNKRDERRKSIWRCRIR